MRKKGMLVLGIMAAATAIGIYFAVSYTHLTLPTNSLV